MRPSEELDTLEEKNPFLMELLKSLIDRKEISTVKIQYKRVKNGCIWNKSVRQVTSKS